MYNAWFTAKLTFLNLFTLMSKPVRLSFFHGTQKIISMSILATRIRSNWQSRVPTFLSFAFYLNLTCQSNHDIIVFTSCQMLK